MRLVVALLLTTFLAAAVIGTAKAEILITVDKSAQRMTVARDGEASYTWPVSTGRSGYATPSGSYTAFRMEADHYSKEWDEAPMPQKLGTPASRMAHREKWTTQSAPHTYRLGESQNEASRLTQTCVQRTGCGTQ